MMNAHWTMERKHPHQCHTMHSRHLHPPPNHQPIQPLPWSPPTALSPSQTPSLRTHQVLLLCWSTSQRRPRPLPTLVRPHPSGSIKEKPRTGILAAAAVSTTRRMYSTSPLLLYGPFSPPVPPCRSNGTTSCFRKNPRHIRAFGFA